MNLKEKLRRCFTGLNYNLDPEINEMGEIPPFGYIDDEDNSPAFPDDEEPADNSMVKEALKLGFGPCANVIVVMKCQEEDSCETGETHYYWEPQWIDMELTELFYGTPEEQREEWEHICEAAKREEGLE
jgi:hypothetical protein